MNEKSVFKWLSCRTRGCKYRKADHTGKLTGQCPKCEAELTLSAIWHYRLTVGGVTTVTPGFARRKDTVDALIAAKEANRRGQLLPGKEKPVMWQEAVAEVETKIKKSTLRDNSKSAYHQSINNLKNFFSGALQDIDIAMCEQYIAARQKQNAAPRTIRGEIALLKKVFTEICRLYPANPLLKNAKPVLHAVAHTLQYIELPPKPEKKTRILSLWEIDYLLSMCDKPWLKLMIQIALSTGLRKENIIEMRYEQIDFINKEIRFEASEMKSKRPFLKSLWPDTIALIVDWRKAQKGSKYVFPSRITANTHINTIDKMWFALLDKCNEGLKALNRPTFDDVCFHTLRHTYATMEYIRCRDIEKVSHELDHADSQITGVYLHLAAFYRGDDPALYFIKFHRPENGEFTPSVHNKIVDGKQDSPKCQTPNDTDDIEDVVCKVA